MHCADDFQGLTGPFLKKAVNQPCNHRKCVLLNNEYNSLKQDPSKHPPWKQNQRKSLTNMAAPHIPSGPAVRRSKEPRTTSPPQLQRWEMPRPMVSLKQPQSLCIWGSRCQPTPFCWWAQQLDFVCRRAPAAIVLGPMGPSLPPDSWQKLPTGFEKATWRTGIQDPLLTDATTVPPALPKQNSSRLNCPFFHYSGFSPLCTDIKSSTHTFQRKATFYKHLPIGFGVQLEYSPESLEWPHSCKNLQSEYDH